PADVHWTLHAGVHSARRSDDRGVVVAQSAWRQLAWRGGDDDGSGAVSRRSVLFRWAGIGHVELRRIRTRLLAGHPPDSAQHPRGRPVALLGLQRDRELPDSDCVRATRRDLRVRLLAPSGRDAVLAVAPHPFFTADNSLDCVRALLVSPSL